MGPALSSRFFDTEFRTGQSCFAHDALDGLQMKNSQSGCASIAEAMGFLSCKRDALHKMLADGRLRSSLIRGRRVILWAELYRHAELPPPEPTGDRLLTVADASRWLTVCRDTLYRLIEDGSLRASRIGTRYRIAERHLLDLVDRTAA